MRKLSTWLWFPCCCMVLSACTTQEFEDATSVSQTSSSEKIQIIQSYISNLHPNATRSGNINILPYIIDRDTIFYVANYPGGGFEIFSNDFALPMVLVRSKEGTFNPFSKLEKTPFDEFIYEAGCNIAINKDFDSKERDSSWNFFSDSTSSKTNNSGLKHVGEGYEVSLKEYTPKGGRLSTKWDQGNPYNKYVPFCTNGSSQHSLVGCGAIAVGQYLLHSHRYFNTPSSTVTSATYESASNTYKFSGSSSAVWDQMRDDASNLSLMEPTSIYLGYLARTLLTKFGETPNAPSITINYYLREFISSELKTLHTWEDFSMSRLLEKLKQGHPAFMSTQFIRKRSNLPTDSIGHSYLIDYAYTADVTYYDVYVSPDLIRPSDGDEEEEDSWLYGIPLEFYHKKYGEISTSYSRSLTEKMISMNWGWGGDYDNVLINGELATWTLYRKNERLESYNNWILY